MARLTIPAGPTDEEVAEYVVTHGAKVADSLLTDRERETERIVKNIPALRGKLTR